jgi:hypothetical protein
MPHDFAHDVDERWMSIDETRDSLIHEFGEAVVMDGVVTVCRFVRKGSHVVGNEKCTFREAVVARSGEFGKFGDHLIP